MSGDKVYVLTEDGRPIKVFSGPEERVAAVARQMNRLDYEASFRERGYRCRSKLYAVTTFTVGDPANFDPTKPPGPPP